MSVRHMSFPAISPVSLLVLALLILNILVVPMTALSAEPSDTFKKVDPNVLKDLSDDGKAEFVVILSEPDWNIVHHRKLHGGREAVIDYLKAFTRQTQAEVIKVIRKTGGVVKRTFWIINAILVIGDRETVNALASLPIVKKIIPNFRVHIIEPVRANKIHPSQTVESWGIYKIRAPEVWALGYTGEGIRIAVLDTGVDISHPALEGKMFTIDPSDPYYPGGWIEFDENGNPVCSAPHDTHGHGTHTSGTALGGDTSDVIIGVAPGAKLMHGLVLPGGSGTFAQVAAGIEWAVEPYDCNGNPTGYPAHVISMSLGASNYYGNELLPAIKAALEANVIVVAAIGNDGEDTSSNPGNIWGVFGIGATDSNDNVAYFSSGEVVNWPNPPDDWPFYDTYPSTYIKPDFSAPGVDITSAVPGGGYEAWSGTSMATPHAAGTVALILQAAGWTDFSEPDLPEKVYEILNSTAVDLGDPGQDIRYGYGRIDAYEAVMKARQYAKPTGVEGYVYDAETSEPVTWATVTVAEINETVPVNNEGYFRIPLDPGNYTLVINAWGYVQQNITVEVTVGNGTVAGVVTDYVTGNPIAGAEIIVTDGVNTYMTYTNSSGGYSISVPPGTYNVTASATGYVNKTVVGVSVSEDEITVVNFALISTSDLCKIYGYVKDSSTGQEIAGANVLILETGYSTVTNESGYYEFTGLYPGNYTLIFNATGYESKEVVVEVQPGESKEVNVSLTPVAQPSGYVAVVGNERYYTSPHLAEIAGNVTGLPVKKYKNVSAIIPDLESGVNFTLIIVDHFYPESNAQPDKNDSASMPKIDVTEVLHFLNLTRDAGIPVIFLATPYSGWDALRTLASANDTYEAYGYPAPDERDYGYKSPEYVKVYVPEILTNSPLFNGVEWDGEENNSKWFYLADTNNTDYADYEVFNFTDDVEVVPIAFVNCTYNNEQGIGIAVWEVKSNVYWYYLGSWGESYWMQYLEPGGDGVYSNNTLQVLKNAIYLAANRLTPIPFGHHNGNPVNNRAASIRPTNYTYVEVYLQRQPYGYIEGYVYDSHGNPLEGAHVIIEGAPFTLVTDSEGHFKHWLPVGTYVVNISKDGYETYSITVDIAENETTSIETHLSKLIWIAVMYDYASQIKNLIESSINGVYVKDFNDWYQLHDEVLSGEYDLVIFAGYYYASLPDSADLFLDIINYFNSTGKGLMFLDNWCGSHDWAYGINLLVHYIGDPQLRDDDYDDGYVYLVIEKTHPIFEGYEVGQKVYIVADSSADYSWFSGFSGEVLASIGADEAGVVGSGVGIKIFPSGSKWVLLAGMAPEDWTSMDVWTEDAKHIFLNAVKWLLAKKLDVTLVPDTAKVGEKVTVYISGGEPGLVVNVTMAGKYIGKVTLDENGSGSITFTVPKMPCGQYPVEAIGKSTVTYYGSALLTIVTSLIVSPTTVSHAERFEVKLLGSVANEKLYLFIDGNVLSFFTTDDTGSADVYINVPYYFGEGQHLVNIVNEKGEVIASAQINIIKGELYDYINNKQTMISNRLNTISNKIDKIDNRVQSVIDKISAVRNLVKNLDAKITTRVDEVKQAIQSSKADIVAVIESSKGDILVAINTSTGTILTPLSTLKEAVGQDIESLSSLVKTLNTTIDNKIDMLNSSLSTALKESLKGVVGEITKVVKDESGNVIATIKTSEGTILANMTGQIKDVKGLIETKSGETYALIDTKFGTVLTKIDDLKKLVEGQSQELTEISGKISDQLDKSKEIKTKSETAANYATIATTASIAALLAALGAIGAIIKKKI